VRSFAARARTASGRGTITFEVLELGQTDGDLPVPKRAVRQSHFVLDDGDTNRQEYRIDFDLSVPRRLPPEDEFTLPAFGLPEPPGAGRRTVLGTYLWVALAGVSCLTLGVVLQILRKRAGRPVGGT